MDGHTFPASEHCYQWSSATEAIRKDVAEAIIKAKSPWDAKRLGASIKNQIQNWNDMKYDVMHNKYTTQTLTQTMTTTITKPITQTMTKNYNKNNDINSNKNNNTNNNIKTIIKE